MYEGSHFSNWKKDPEGCYLVVTCSHINCEREKRLIVLEELYSQSEIFLFFMLGKLQTAPYIWYFMCVGELSTLLLSWVARTHKCPQNHPPKSPSKNICAETLNKNRDIVVPIGSWIIEKRHMGHYINKRNLLLTRNSPEPPGLIMGG